MSAKQITIKHNKHHVHPCPIEKKLSLLNLLISKYSDMEILIVRANSLDVIKEAVSADNVTILSDDELKNSTKTYELLISYDLPATPALYINRLFCATEMALILLDAKEQNKLYPIETVLKRVIKQEIIEGFEYENNQKLKVAQKPIERPKEYEFKKTYEEKPKYDNSKKDGFKSDKKSFDKPRRDNDSKDKSKSWEKKDKSPNKFLGKDENGKAIFSGKSGDRNHRHDGTPKEKYGAPKKVGRKINIKALKPKETPES
jgi:superfamily II DNA/RNA helicase